MAMDVKRDPKILKRKKMRRIALAVVGGAAVVAISVAVSNLKPAAPTAPANTVWFGTVQRGPMVREVRGQIAQDRAVLDDAHGDGFAHNVESILEPGPPPRGAGTRFPTKFHHDPG